MTKKRKTIEAVRMSRNWRAKVSRQIARMSVAEEIAFFNRRASEASARKTQTKAA